MDPISIILQIAVGIALQYVGGLLSSSSKPAATSQSSPEYTGSYAGGVQPQSFVLGTYGYAGKLEYENTWGSAGQTQNAYLAQVFSFGNLPITGCTAIYANTDLVTKSSTGHVTQGFPISDFNDGTADHAWWEFFSGSQTTASSYLTGKFSTDPHRPWTTTAVGYGIPYMITTALVETTIWDGFPQWIFQLQGIKLYDPRKDSTKGGSGTQRLGNEATYAFSDNLAVMIYNIFCGITYQGSWVWGMKTPAILPYTWWKAAMDKCDEDIALRAGGTENRYSGGLLVKFTDKPVDVINKLAAACNMRLCEVAGSWYCVVDDPGSSDATFSDTEVIVSQETTWDPFVNMDALINGGSFTYLSPKSAWAQKDGAEYSNAAYLAADDGRENLTSLDLTVINSNTQGQRLLVAKVKDSRNFTTHVVPLRPIYSQYNPLTVLTWNSADNQYSGKDFLVTSMTESPNGVPVFTIRETDPSVHSWTPLTDEQSEYFPPLDPVAPGQQVATGWHASATHRIESDGSTWMPTIEFFVPAAQPDVRAVEIHVRESWSTKREVWTGTPSYDIGAATPSYVLDGNFRPSVSGHAIAYEVRGRFLPFTNRPPSAFSAWFTVTMDSVSPVPVGSVPQAGLIQNMSDFIDYMLGTGAYAGAEGGKQSLQGIISGLTSELDGHAGDAAAGIAALDTKVSTATKNALAALNNFSGWLSNTTTVPVGLGPGVTTTYKQDKKTTSDAIGIAKAQAGTGYAAGLVALDVIGTPTTASVTIGILGRIKQTDAKQDAGWQLVMTLVNGKVTSEIHQRADKVFWTDSSGKKDVGFSYIDAGDGKGPVLTVMSSRLHYVQAGVIEVPDKSNYWHLDNSKLRKGAFRVST